MLPTHPFRRGAQKKAVPTLVRFTETLASAAGDEDDEMSPVPPRAYEKRAVSAGALPLQAGARPAPFRPRLGAAQCTATARWYLAVPARLSPPPAAAVGGPGGKACL